MTRLNTCSTRDFVKKCCDCVLRESRSMFRESTGCTKKTYLAEVAFHELCLGKCWEVMTMFRLLKIRTSIDIFRTEKYKVTFDLKYIFIEQF